MIRGDSTFANSRMHYSRWGTGNRLIIAIHGFGEESKTFASIGERIPIEFSLIAIDLPLHGETDWKEDQYIAPEELLNCIDAVCIICGLDTSFFTLIGYSMGARIALSLYEIDPKRINHLLLLAPDGLQMHFIYWLSTQTIPGRTLFRWTMHHPAPFLGLARFASRISLVKESQLRFTKLYLQQESTRMQVYEIWNAFRKFKANQKKIASLLNKYHTPLTLVFGRYDPVIQAGQGEAFSRNMKREIRLEILEGGHQLLNEKHAARICSMLFNLDKLTQ